MVIDGSTVMLPNIFDPSELRSDVTGKIVRFLHEDGAEVSARITSAIGVVLVVFKQRSNVFFSADVNM